MYMKVYEAIWWYMDEYEGDGCIWAHVDVYENI